MKYLIWYFRVLYLLSGSRVFTGIYGVPDVRVYPKYRVIPDISGYLIPNDFHTGSGRVLEKMLGSGRISGTHWALATILLYVPSR